jgi:SDR family mycofactocin-dependent oxidoreductase
MMGRVQGKVAFITGAGRGQGRSHAVTLAEEGADIIATDICEDVKTLPYDLATEEDLAETARLVEKTGQRCFTRKVDVRDFDGLKTAADEGAAELGGIDIVIANAGIGGFPAVKTLDIPEENWQEQVDINLTGAFKTIKAAVPHIVAGNKGGSVVITSSMAAVKANEHTAAYAAAKAGLIALMRVLALELGPRNIRVNTVHPTTVNTRLVHNDDMYKLFRPELEHPTREDFYEGAQTLNRLPVPEIESVDVSNMILFLTSSEGRYITGQQLIIDAGACL